MIKRPVIGMDDMLRLISHVILILNPIYPKFIRLYPCRVL